jgi:hypothetical protein
MSFDRILRGPVRLSVNEAESNAGGENILWRGRFPGSLPIPGSAVQKLFAVLVGLLHLKAILRISLDCDAKVTKAQDSRHRLLVKK